MRRFGFVVIAVVLAQLMAVMPTWADDVTDADELHLSSTETSVPDMVNEAYMRITMDREVKAGKWTLLAVPAVLDGYYFGADAPRYKVADYDDTMTVPTITATEMDDAADFQPNQLYLIKSEGDVSEIVIKSPGELSSVEKTPSQFSLICMEYDDVNLNPTGIDAVSHPDSQYLNNSDAIYDFAGRAMRQASHGLLIINGKKVMVK